MKKTEIIKELDRFPYSKEDYWVLTGGAMVLYGIKEQTSDIDLGCNKTMADKLERDGYFFAYTESGNRHFKYGDSFAIFETWIEDTSTLAENIPVITIAGLIAMKRELGREKDYNDIRLIAGYLKKTDEIFLKLTKTCEEQPEKRWLPACYFDICSADGTAIGKCDLRIGHNDKTYIGGNIGYEIDEHYRGHHYAAKACRLLFQLAKKHGLDYLIITCDPSNIASYKTCEYAGGRYIETADIPEDNEMYAEGKRQVRIYRFEL